MLTSSSSAYHPTDQIRHFYYHQTLRSVSVFTVLKQISDPTCRTGGVDVSMSMKLIRRKDVSGFRMKNLIERVGSVSSKSKYLPMMRLLGVPKYFHPHRSGSLGLTIKVSVFAFLKLATIKVKLS